MCDAPGCVSDRILFIYGKCSDLFNASLGAKEYNGYVPYDLGIGGGDDIQFTYCLDCGKIQGSFPREDPEFTQSEDEDDGPVEFA